MHPATPLKLAMTWFASPGRAVDAHSLFQVASMSKWVTAWGVMALADEGRIDVVVQLRVHLELAREAPRQRRLRDKCVGRAV